MQASPGGVEGRLNIGFFAKSASLFRLLRPLAFAQTYTRAAAIFVDEFDARGLQGARFSMLLGVAAVAGVSSHFHVIDCIPIEGTLPRLSHAQPNLRHARAILTCALVTGIELCFSIVTTQRVFNEDIM